MKSAQLVSVTQAAKILKVSDETLRRWEKLGHIVPARTPGGARRYDISHLEEIREAADGQVKLGKLPQVLNKVYLQAPVSPSFTPPSTGVSAKSPIKNSNLMDYYLRPHSLNYPNSAGSSQSASASDNSDSLEKPHTELFNNQVPQLAGSGFFRSFNVAKMAGVSAASISLATLAITGSLVAGYLTSPAGTKSLMSAAVSSPLSPFNSLAKGYLSLVLPQKAKELGLNQEITRDNDTKILGDKDSSSLTVSQSPSIDSPDSLVLAATNKRPGVITFNADTIINADTTLQGSISLEGTVIKGLVQTITAGSNIAVVNGDTPNPTISVTLPTNLVNSFATSSTGTKVSGDIIIGSGLSLATDTKTITASTPTLSTVRSAGGCSGCLTDSDVADTITISSSGSVDVGALSGKVTAAKGGLGADVTPAGAGELLYSTSTSAYGHLAAGTSTYVLTSGGAGVPVWVAQSSIASSTAFNDITSGTNTQAAMVVSTGASLTYNGGTATSGVINANQLLGATWAAPGTIGSVTATTGAFTSLTATTFNKLTLTAPTTGSTLTIADGKTLTASNSLTLQGTDSTTFTFPVSSDTVAVLGDLKSTP